MIVVDMSLRARVAALVASEPALADEFLLRGTLVEIVDRAGVSAPELRLPGDYVRARLATGTPLLDGINLPVPATAGTLFGRLTVAMLADSSARSEAEMILAAVRSHRLHVEQLVGEVVVSHSDHLAALADAAGVTGPLLETLADLTSRPLLTSVGQRLRPALGLAAWTRGHCPICGARPLLAERGDLTPPSDAEWEERLILRCGRCTTGWMWCGTSCPDCHVGNLEVLETREICGAGLWSVLGCDTCRSYVKLAASLRSSNLGQLMVDDLATWSLDRTALAAGYRRTSEPARRLEHGDPAGEDLDDD